VGPGCAKVQFRLSLIDASGKRFGADPPWTVPLPSGDLVPQLHDTGRYQTPVTSGNAYPRKLLEQLFPVPSDFAFVDGYLNTVAPFYVPIISIDDELGGYSRHDQNYSAYAAGVDAGRLRQRVQHELVKERYQRATAASRGHSFPPGLLMRDPEHLMHRLGLLRLDPGQPAALDDTRRKLLRAMLLALWRDQQLPAFDKAYQGGVALAVAALPLSAARATLAFALGGGRRPAWLRKLARALRRSGEVV